MSATLGRRAVCLDSYFTILLDGHRPPAFILKADAGAHHAVGHKYCCSDSFVRKVLAGLLHPLAKGGMSKLHMYLSEFTGWRASLLPRPLSPGFLTFVEKVLQHPLVDAAEALCRAAADKRVLASDGQYSTLMGVIYQSPHGPSADNGAAMGPSGTPVQI